MLNYIPLRIYTGDELFELNKEKAEPLIQDVLFENDYIMITAPPKMGKTILALQMACSLSIGSPFLGTFEIPKAQMVWYFATEGKDEDIKDRIQRISRITGINKDNFVLICSAGLQFNTLQGRKYVEILLDKYKDRLPKVIFIDALYRAIKGSLKQDDVVNEFHNALGMFSERCDAATVLIHHTSRPLKLLDGTLSPQSEESTYGSQFLLAGVDHQFFLAKWKKESNSKDRFLQCDQLQRSGHIIDSLRLRLSQPDPLGFSIISIHMEERVKIMDALKEGKMTVDDIIRKTGIGRSTIYLVMKDLVDEGKVKKEGTKTKFYFLK